MGFFFKLFLFLSLFNDGEEKGKTEGFMTCDKGSRARIELGILLLHSMHPKSTTRMPLNVIFF